MQHVRSGYRGISVFVDLNADRFLTVGTIVLSVAFATTITSWLQAF